MSAAPALHHRRQVWCHTCWGNPLAQKVEANYSYEPILPYLDRLDVDVVTFETADNKGAELEASKIITKEFLKKYKIPTGDFEKFDSEKDAINYIES